MKLRKTLCVTIGAVGFLVLAGSVATAKDSRNIVLGHDVTIGAGFTQVALQNYVSGGRIGFCEEYKSNATTATAGLFAISTADLWTAAGISMKLPYSTGTRASMAVQSPSRTSQLVRD